MKPMKPKKSKTIGTIAHGIGFVLGILILVFGIYVALSSDRVISIIIANAFGGITVSILSVIGIIGLLKENIGFVFLTRNTCGVTAFFSLFYLVSHGILPFYHYFYEDSYKIKNAYYMAAGGFFLLLIVSLYSTYIANSLYRSLLEDLEDSNDIESLKTKRSMDSSTNSSVRSTVKSI